MSYSRSVGLQGGDELERRLRSLPKKIQQQVALDALQKGAKVMERFVRRETPKRSGRLRRAIDVTATRGKRGRVQFSVRNWSGHENFEDSYYGAFVEFGHKVGSRKLRRKKKIGTIVTQKRGRRKSIYEVSDERKDVPPNPFMKRGFELGKHASLAAIIARLKTILPAAAKRI